MVDNGLVVDALTWITKGKMEGVVAGSWREKNHGEIYSWQQKREERSCQRESSSILSKHPDLFGPASRSAVRTPG